MYALTRILDLILGKERIAPIAKRLPLLVYYGVNNTPAALFSLMGIKRIDALRLARAYISEAFPEVSLQSLKAWGRAKSQEEMIEILQGSDKREIDRETLIILAAE